MNSPVFPCARPLQPSCRSLRSGGDTGNLLCFRGVEQWDCAVSSSWIVSCDPVSKFIGILNRLFFLSRKIVQFEKINFFCSSSEKKRFTFFPVETIYTCVCVNNFDRFLSKFYHRRERASRPWLFTTRFGIFRGFPVHAINLARPETNGVSSVDKKSRLARIGL